MLSMIVPIAITDAVLASSSVPETDYPPYVAGTTYGKGSKVIVAATHRVYESTAAGNVGAYPPENLPDPDDDEAPYKWVELRATRRWLPFDQRVGEGVNDENDLRFELLMSESCDAVALFGLRGSHARVRVTHPNGMILSSQAKPIVDTSGIVDFLTYINWEAVLATELVFENIAAIPGSTVEISVYGTQNRRLSEIAIGTSYEIGPVIWGASTDTDDYSTVERDTFGNARIVQRAYAQTTTYPVRIAALAKGRVQRLLAEQRARPTALHNGDEAGRMGLISYGIIRPVSARIDGPRATFLNVEHEGLI